MPGIETLFYGGDYATAHPQMEEKLIKIRKLNFGIEV